MKGFYIHLSIYLIVISFLGMIDVLDHSSNWWFYWPALGWGVAVVIHGVSVLFDTGVFGSDWEERKIKDLLAKQSR